VIAATGKAVENGADAVAPTTFVCSEMENLLGFSELPQGFFKTLDAGDRKTCRKKIGIWSRLG
jgi:hypothetical protein